QLSQSLRCSQSHGNPTPENNHALSEAIARPGTPKGIFHFRVWYRRAKLITDMFLTFKVRVRTQAGQTLWLTGDHQLLGNSDTARALPMQRVDDDLWQTTLDFQHGHAPNAVLTWNYILREADGSVSYDSGKDKRINPAKLAPGGILGRRS